MEKSKANHFRFCWEKLTKLMKNSFGCSLYISWIMFSGRIDPQTLSLTTRSPFLRQFTMNFLVTWNKVRATWDNFVYMLKYLCKIAAALSGGHSTVLHFNACSMERNERHFMIWKHICQTEFVCACWHGRYTWQKPMMCFRFMFLVV